MPLLQRLLIQLSKLTIAPKIATTTPMIVPTLGPLVPIAIAVDFEVINPLGAVVEVGVDPGNKVIDSGAG